VHSADVSHEVAVAGTRLSALKARSTAHLVVSHANVRLKVHVLTKRAAAHVAHVLTYTVLSCLIKLRFGLAVVPPRQAALRASL
jgi:hypothetical protein